MANTSNFIYFTNTLRDIRSLVLHFDMGNCTPLCKKIIYGITENMFVISNLKLKNGYIKGYTLTRIAL